MTPDQVSQAVGKLQQAHVDLHEQSELARQHADTLYQIERAVTESNGADPGAAIDQIKGILASRS